MVTTAEIAGYTGCERHSFWCLSCIIRTGGALRPLSMVCSVWRQLERRIQLRFQDIATVYGYSQRYRRLLRAQPILQSKPLGSAKAARQPYYGSYYSPDYGGFSSPSYFFND
jgi:hypothetical protein